MASFLQSPKKAKKKESASSNVFTMFEQSQIQEFKEARAFFLIFPNTYMIYYISKQHKP